MKSTLRVPFGLKDDRLYEPTQVDNGKDCGCVCPACKKPLWAKQNAQTPHFAHAPGVDCARGFETAVHLAVKQIIAEKMEVRLPAVVWKNPLPRKNEFQKLYIERVIQLDSVVLEKVIDDIKPDIVVSRNNEVYLVEVAVTHFIDGEKQQKINNKKIPTFEIDVSKLKGGFTLEELEKAIYTSSNYQAEWKYHPRLEELNQEVLQAENKRISQVEEENQNRKRKFEIYRNLSQNDKLQINLKSIGLTKQQMNKLTSFVPWDGSFGVDRIVWQSAVLAYIGKIQEEDGWEEFLPCMVNSSACIEWMEEVFEINPQVPNGENIAVFKYFKFLEQKGILKYLSHKEFELILSKEQWPKISG